MHDVRDHMADRSEDAAKYNIFTAIDGFYCALMVEVLQHLGTTVYADTSVRVCGTSS